MTKDHAILLPGIVMPPDLAYGALIEALGPGTDARPKPLEVYAGDTPPSDYGLETEVAGLLAFADAAGFERFHLVGYSGGGAVSLYAAAHPDASGRLHSLALIEPAWAGHQGQTPEEIAARDAVDEAVTSDDPAELMRGFARGQLAPGVEPPPSAPGPPPDWMALRPAGIRAITGAFATSDIDLGTLRRFERPVYLAYGGRSNPDFYERMVLRLVEVFPDATLERYDQRHHFDPPHRTEPDRLALALRALWERAAG